LDLTSKIVVLEIRSKGTVISCVYSEYHIFVNEVNDAFLRVSPFTYPIFMRSFNENGNIKGYDWKVWRFGFRKASVAVSL